ncbi:MAG: B12-binding domain-containing radical SAM protein [Candidatus Helarchaeota archaeon]
MVRVLLLNPPTNLLLYKEDRCQNEIESHLHRIIRPPISLMGLAAISEQLGHQTLIIDAPIERIDLTQITKFLNRWKPHWVVVNTSLETLNSDLLTLNAAKVCGAKTVIFGYAPTLKDKEIIQNNLSIDFAIRGEPEKTFKELLGSSLHLKSIKGLTYRENGLIKQNPNRPFINNLDELPFPAHHLIRTELYRVPTTREIFATIQTSRGCPQRCTFCLSHLLNGFKVRKRTVGNVIEEIKFLVQRLHIHNFFFRADNFTFDKKWVLKLCREIRKNRLNITWFCNSRVDSIDKEMLFAMKQAGCQLITFGVESGNPQILNYIKKGITKDQAKKTIALTKKMGILTGAFYILGLPGETIQSIYDTIQFSIEVDSDGVEFIPFIPFSGTEALNQTPSSLDPQLIQKLVRYALIKYYFRPKIALRYLYHFYVKTRIAHQLIPLILITVHTIRRFFR